jgi:hypothetical protein
MMSRELSLLLYIAERIKVMTVQTQALTAAVSKLSTDVDSLVAAHSDTSAQAAVDAATAALEAEDAKVVAALNPPVAPTGATGPAA